MARQRHIGLAIFAFCSMLSARLAFYQRPPEPTAVEQRWGVMQKNADTLGLIHGFRYYIYGIGVIGLLIFAEDYFSGSWRRESIHPSRYRGTNRRTSSAPPSHTTSRRALIEHLRFRSDVTVEESSDSWLVRIPKGDFLCEVRIPKTVFEWFAFVFRRKDRKEIWRDWMDHYDASDAELEMEMADCIAAFIERVTHSEQILPVKIYEEPA